MGFMSVMLTLLASLAVFVLLDCFGVVLGFMEKILWLGVWKRLDSIELKVFEL